MLRKLAIFFCMFMSLYAQDDVDYDKLDPSYYKYIKLYHLTNDSQIKALINNLNAAKEKTGLFIGLNIGYLANDISSNAEQNYLFGYGAKFGYQSFKPSFFESIIKPNYVGRRIYIQYLSAIPKEDNIGKIGFSSITLNGDILIDLPIFKGYGAGIIMGAGLGNVVHGYNANSKFGGMVNAGFGVSILNHNRIELELKLIADKDIEWIGSLFTLGYQYVF